MRPLWIGTGFKMTKTRAQAVAYARRLRADLDPGVAGVRPFVLPPATALAEVSEVLDGGPVLTGAQNAHWEDEGAWTGELSVPQVADAGARVVEIGHSERREHFGETDETVRLKARATLRHGLVPLVCCGEDAAVFAAGGSVDHVLRQVHAALDGLPEGPDGLGRVLVAYEPIWAIGERGRPPRPEEVADVHAALAAVWGDRVAAILYGGSVTTDNAADLLHIPGVGGLFVGRAAWDVEGYLRLLDIARQRVGAMT
ncbi:triose-phosphate isomerase [Nocardiopsis sp. MG754419]|uniref:triose-phosphate isomerase n=1 Tax=Nocardiopsis sp. MG754419 TaxID=2259865 RepID=UPI0027DACD3E|nr:triose-phosphate isomerase [Nocardiopsis sp. MG754419]MBR8743224.1 triose-phosphate isomerase [Nocardiopsis sp. MG754419]